PQVTDDIQDKLGFREKNVIRMSFFRGNLSYVVRKTENKLLELKHILECVPGTGIVYVRNRAQTKEISDFLNAEGIPTTFYHAGLDPVVKDKRQRAWTQNLYRVVVATNAFGMGIDKPDVRTVVHMDIPSSIEAYFQEAGRAGRDGQRSYAVLLHSPGDKRTVSKRISDNFPKEDFIRNVYEKLGYYHQMAVGDGRGCTYAFSLGEFCQHYMLPILPTDSSLRILTRMGYIEYLDEMDYSARLLFTAGRDDLYRLHHDKTTEEVMNIILRNYSGVFTDYAYIDEHMICSRAGIDRDMLYTILMSLQSQGVIRYVPERRTPVITWTRERIDTQLIRFDPEVYRQRKEEFKERIGAMMEYVTRETGCRSAILLKYFGEHQSKPCLCCDLCQEKVQGDLSRGEFETIMQDILDTFHSSPDNPQKVYTLPYDRKKIDIVLHYMVNEGHILMKDGKIITKND
ncbi:MAG: RecQ family ATP-dependent DNA helicase, partial [Bacteroidaceae bacterium]|nr:RecQ family ATP-dependent DNA helicase [Bacteroidaceae bacterium]